MNQFFSVMKPISISGKVFVPCISYALLPNLVATVTALVAKGQARVYESNVAFESGKVVGSEKKTKKVAKTFTEAKKAIERPAISEKDVEAK